MHVILVLGESITLVTGWENCVTGLRDDQIWSQETPWYLSISTGKEGVLLLCFLCPACLGLFPPNTTKMTSIDTQGPVILCIQLLGVHFQLSSLIISSKFSIILTRNPVFSFSFGHHSYLASSSQEAGSLALLNATFQLSPFPIPYCPLPCGPDLSFDLRHGWFLGPHQTAEWWCPAPDAITQIISSCDQDLL